MAVRFLQFLLFALLFPLTLTAQSIVSFTDNFDDGALDTTWNGETHMLWKADHPRTFGLSEGDGVLSIDYTRDGNSQPWDNFNFTPPEQVDVANTPIITLDIKSAVSTTYTLKPIYSNGNDRLIDKEIPGDNQWHTYQFELQESNYSGGYLTRMYMYFDGGSSTPKSGLVQFDNLKIAGFSIQVSNVTAEVVDSSHVDLAWMVGEDVAPEVDHYKIYRSTENGFSIGEETLVGDTTATVYHDRGLNNYTSYYYRVTAVDNEGEEYPPSEQVSVRTYSEGDPPLITVTGTSDEPVGKYEKFEITFSLDQAAFTNPYNPDEIDVTADFVSPDEDTITVFGFYDNYENRDTWKIRFAAPDTGIWSYNIHATDLGGTASTESSTFQVVNNNYNGPLQLSSTNSEYLMHHDSTAFYGISVYYPWNVRQNRLDDFIDEGGNMFGYWNSTYDGAGNGGGRYLLESIRSGLGRMDQQKAARIDQLINWAEQRDAKIMYAIWAHPFLRVSGQPWSGGEWSAHNPYKEIVSVDKFYSDSLAWEYQEHQYRYIIARWGYSRAMGIWEITNEIHGTTGYVQHEHEARKWVAKVDSFFKRYDPYQRPTTVSFETHANGSVGDTLGDISNAHYYETQGYPTPYNNNVRNGLWNMANVIEGLGKRHGRAAMFGEAGYYSMFSDVGSEAYTEEFHNALWVSLAKGMASTPFWWEHNMSDILTDERLKKYGYLKQFVEPLNISHNNYSDAFFDMPGIDGYGRYSGNNGFLWFRSYSGPDLSNREIRSRGFGQGSYAIEFFDTWSGGIIKKDTIATVRNLLYVTMPQLDTPRRDFAIRFQKLNNGEEATGLSMFFQDSEITSASSRETRYPILIHLRDDAGRLVTDAATVNLFIEGPGRLSSESVETSGGVVSLDYLLDAGESGEVTITAEAEGLESAAISNYSVTDLVDELDDQRPGEFTLEQNYPNPFNPTTTINYGLPESATVQLQVFDVTGRLVQTLVNQQQNAGRHTVTFDAGNMASGVYFYRLQAGSFSEVQRMMLIK